MNERDYPILYKTVGAFDIYKNTYWQRCYVRALCQDGDDARVHAIAQTFLDMNNVYFLKEKDTVQYHAIRRRTVSDKRAKSSLYEVAIETNLKPEAVSDWLEQNAMDIEPLVLSREAFSVDKVTVGPCRYQLKDLMWTRIRFDGYSFPLYFDKSGTYNPKATKDQVRVELKNDPATAKEVETLLETPGLTTSVIAKALTRPMNKSSIVESGSFAPKIFVPVRYENIKASGQDGYGVVNTAVFEGYECTSDKTKLAAPGLEPVAVFAFTCLGAKDANGYRSNRNDLIVVVDNNEVYKAKKLYRWYGQRDNRWLNANSYGRTWLDDSCVIKKSDLIPLDKDDEFARERASRALSRKL